jgi:hypothetical protein
MALPGLLGSLAALLMLLNASPSWAKVTAEQDEAKVVIEVDGKPFAEYRTEINGTPSIWPIIGPTGAEMTRAYPMREGNPEERKDHPHHRSFWIAHGDVDGLSFWHRETIRHRAFKRVESGDEAVIVAVNDWLDKDGKPIAEDQRTFRFGADKKTRWIDSEVVVKASYGPVTFGDTKEGLFAVRVAGTMRVGANKGGEIVNSHGDKDKAAWGKRAPWVDYHGPVEGERVGVAIFNHPSSFRFPTCWHVRTYGLFAANPFGLSDFLGSKHDGTLTMNKGDQFTLRHKVVLHRGDTESAGIAELFKAYAAEKK